MIYIVIANNDYFSLFYFIFLFNYSDSMNTYPSYNYMAKKDSSFILLYNLLFNNC